MKADFTRKLMKWNRDCNRRAMPWKGEKDPYKIWLSEIILQQTRVEQGLDYYHRFVSAFPTIADLAAAPQQKVFKLWEGLGYYTRCKNLLATASYIDTEKSGVFPNTYEAILALKGIGPYTAAAIGSFAFNLPHAVTDGNVLRVLARYFGISTPIDSSAGKKLFNELANQLLDKKQPGLYNQAIMDFGATVCKPQQPLCATCPQKKECHAFQNDKVKELPVKEKQLKKKTRWLYYLVVDINGEVLIQKRSSKDIWENLYEFVLIESASAIEPGEKHFRPLLEKKLGSKSFQIRSISPVFRQQLTHQTINGQFIDLQINTVPSALKTYERIKKSMLKDYPFPKFITAYLQRDSHPLQLF